MSDDRTRTAWHESSHAAMAWSLGHRIDVVSLLPSKRWLAVCFSSPGALDAEVLAGIRPVGAPLALQPASFRSHMEGRILVALAGGLGEELWLMHEHSTEYLSTADDRRVEQAVREVALSPRHRELLARGDDSTRPSRTDSEKASEFAAMLVDEAEVNPYLCWLEASARRISRDPDFVRLVSALVPVLLEYQEIPGDEAERLFDEANGRH